MIYYFFSAHIYSTTIWSFSHQACLFLVSRPKWPSSSFVSSDGLITAMAYRLPHVVCIVSFQIMSSDRCSESELWSFQDFCLDDYCLHNVSGYGRQVRKHKMVGCNNWTFFPIQYSQRRNSENQILTCCSWRSQSRAYCCAVS